MPKRALVLSFAIAAVALMWARPLQAGPVISPGTPTTIVPSYLTDGTYWFPTTLSPLGLGEFLLPIDISSVVNLQSWQFDLIFDNTVVQEVAPVPDDGSSGIYGAEFTAGDPSSLSFILGGFPLNVLGEVDAVAGAYPNALAGPSGNGVLAFILFQCVDPDNCSNPGFGTGGGQVVQGAPEPATLLLLASGLALFCGRRFLRRRHRN